MAEIEIVEVKSGLERINAMELEIENLKLRLFKKEREAQRQKKENGQLKKELSSSRLRFSEMKNHLEQRLFLSIPLMFCSNKKKQPRKKTGRTGRRKRPHRGRS